jgi:hypothetical protein
MTASLKQNRDARLLQAALVLLLIIASTFSLRSTFGELGDSARFAVGGDSSSLLASVEAPATELALPQTPAALQALVQPKHSLAMLLIALISAFQMASRIQAPGPLFRLPIPPPGRFQRSRLHAYLN